MQNRHPIITVALAGFLFVADTGQAQNRRPSDSTRTAPRPNYAAPLGGAYTAEDVTVPTPMGHTLAGTLTLPRGASATVEPVVVGTVVEWLDRRRAR